ncbi:MAG TPA: rod shape-determining protein RodA [bacterium]|nr:rod shape-determining protein RodA [bacterium]
MFDKRLKYHFHWPLLWVTLALSVVGLLNLYSATYDIAVGSVSPLFVSQLVWFAVGIALGMASLLIDYRILLRLAYPLYAVSVILLALVPFFGKEVAGNRNWLMIGPFTMQPSEFAKIAFIIVMARFLSDHPTTHGYGVRGLLRPLALLLPPLLLILAGKDIGSSLFLILTFASLVMFAGVRAKVVLLCVAIGVVGAVGMYKKVLSGHQKARIEAFLHPDADPKGIGYHLLQSKIAVGSGQIIGKGYLKGMHNKLLYLPEKHTDFIFPVLAEEWGFVGSSVVLGLYLAILVFGIQLASKAKESFGVFLALGVTALFFWQVAINLGGVLGLMPLTGVTLPLLSYGGSSLVTILIGISLLLNISMRRFMF